MAVVPGSLDLIGRSTELGQLVDLIGRHAGSVALLAGEPGIGKTRLLNEALRRSGVSATTGISSPASLGRPFDLVQSAVEPTVRWWSSTPTALAAVGDSLGHLLRSIAPAMVLDDSGATPPHGELIGAAIALLRFIDPDLLVLEDIHWADVESLQVVERLLASPDRPSLIATYRPEELIVGQPAAELIRMIESRYAPLHLHLEPFGPAEIRAYVQAVLRDDPDARTLERLHQRTGGNPFFLEQLLLRNDGGSIELRRSALPWTLTETIRHQLDTLTDEQRDLLAVAAILGSPFEFDLLAAATEASEPELIDRLRSVVERGVLVEEELDLFRFRHELVREAITESMLGRERRRLHDRSFLALSAVRPNDFAELARHARGAGRLDDLVTLAPRGVQHYLATGSTFQALVLAEAALSELPDHPLLLELAARAAWLIGRVDTARRHAERWLQVAEREQPEREPDALALVARIAFEAGDRETQQRIIDDLECRVQGQADSPTRAQLLAVLAQHRMLMGESEEAVAIADQAIALADRLGLADVRRRALVERGSARLAVASAGREALRELEAIAVESELAGDDVAAARAWFNLGGSQDLDDAERSLQRMRDAAVRCGFDAMAVQSYAVRKVELSLRRGDLAEARQWAGRSRLLGHDSKTSVELAHTDAMLALEAGDLDDARSMINELSAVARPTNKTFDPNWPIALHMVLAARDGDRDAALAALDQLGPGDDLALLIVWSLRDLAALGIGTSELRDVRDHLVAEAPSTTGRAAVSLIDALDPASADEGALLGVLGEEFRVKGDRCAPEPNEVIIRAEVHLGLARLALARPSSDDSRNHDVRDHALAAARILDTWPGARRAEALALASRGRSTDSSESVITGRELDVARLLAAGLSNGQIADELFIARKTVSTHVSNILAKLDMRSRTEIATWAIENGLADPPADPELAAQPASAG